MSFKDKNIIFAKNISIKRYKIVLIKPPIRRNRNIMKNENSDE